MAVVVVRAENAFAAQVELGLLGLSVKGPLLGFEADEGLSIFMSPYSSPIKIPNCRLLLEDVDDDATAVAVLHGTNCSVSKWAKQGMKRGDLGEVVLPPCEQQEGLGFIAADVNLFRPKSYL